MDQNQEQQTLEEALAEPPETPGKPEAPEQPEQPEPQRVPLPELIEERKARQAAQAELSTLQEKYGTLEERVELITEKLDPPPDPEDDPFGDIARRIDEQGKSVAEIKDALAKGQEEQQQATAQSRIQAMEQTFASNHADYFQAMGHLKERQVAQGVAFGLSHEEAEQRFLRDTASVIQAAVRNNKNPAEVAYNWAKENGFSAGNGKASEQTPSRGASLNTVAEGLKSEGLANSGSAPPSDIPSAEELSTMPQAEFDEWYDKLGEKGFRKVMGG